MAQETQAPASGSQAIAVPAGTKVVLALIGAVKSRSAQPGDTVNCQSTFPLAVDGQMAIPPGTYLKGNIDILVRPTRFSSRAEFRMDFTQMIFAGGYTVETTAIANVNARVSSRSDVLLDNGTQFEVVFERPLHLDSAKVAAAVARSQAPRIGQWKSATQCRPVPPTPGTSDTYIPGTSGTPSTTVPGGPGMPDISIPGSPGTPGTLIPGIPGTAAMLCPPAPVIRPEAVAHREKFTLKTAVKAGTQQLPAGNYEASWTGLGPDAQVSILRHGKPVSNLPATVVAQRNVSPHSTALLRTDPYGSSSLQLLQFQGRSFALRFE